MHSGDAIQDHRFDVAGARSPARCFEGGIRRQGVDGPARGRRIRPAGNGVPARDLRRADRRLFCSQRGEARAGHLPQVRPAGPASAQPPGGREGQAPRFARALPGFGGAPHPSHQVPHGRGDDPRGHPRLVRLLPRTAGRRGEIARRDLRRARQVHRRPRRDEAVAAQGTGAARRRQQAAGEIVRRRHGADDAADHSAGRDRKGRPMNEAKRNPDRGAPREDPAWPASPVAETRRPEHPEGAEPAGERQRARTMSRKEMARQFRQQMAAGGLDPELEALAAELEATRPKVRADCAVGPRPCPYVSCKFNLYVDVNPRTGSVKMNFPDKELWEIADTCALDVADRGGITLEEVGAIMNLTRERVRQLETRGLTKLRVIADDEPRNPPVPKGGGQTPYRPQPDDDYE